MVIYPLIQSYAMLVVLLYHLLARIILLILVRICTCMTVNNMELAKNRIKIVLKIIKYGLFDSIFDSKNKC